jgi:hypothetical protein
VHEGRRGVDCSVVISPLAGSPLACGSVLFRHRGHLRVTVIAKATFALVPDGIATLASPAAIVVEDVHVDEDLSGSLQAASDLAPHRPRVDVTLVGHACAVGRAAPATVARLAIFRERALIDKTLHVYGDRAHPGGGIVPTPDAVRPFDRMPLTYERAHASRDDPSGTENPVGTAEPNLVDPRDPKKPACFGPISPDWPSRRRLLATVDRRALEASVAEIPDDFDWRYFQAAPPDQQLDVLRGDEWIVLDGLHPTLPRVQTRLPSVVAAARVQAAGTSRHGAEPLTLVADTLAIDGDRQTCEVVWRGSLPLAGGEAALAMLRILVGLEVPGQPLAWPAPPSAEPPAKTDGVDVVADGGETLVTTDPRALAMAPATPFEGKGAVPSALAVAVRAGPMPVVVRAPSHLTKTTDVPEGLAVPRAMPFAPVAAMPAPSATTALKERIPGSEAVVVASQVPEARPAPPAVAAPPELPAPPAMIGPLATLEMAEREASPAEEATKPAAPIAPLVAASEALPLDAFPIERCAATAASMARRAEDRAKILEENELTPQAWDALVKHWTEAISRETKRGKTALLEAYDQAYVARLEEERGPIRAEDYARLVVAGERGDAEEALAKLTLPPGAMMRLRRVWVARIAADAAVGASVRAATEAARDG